jgi:hypothetical protein
MTKLCVYGKLPDVSTIRLVVCPKHNHTTSNLNTLPREIRYYGFGTLDTLAELPIPKS